MFNFKHPWILQTAPNGSKLWQSKMFLTKINNKVLPRKWENGSQKAATPTCEKNIWFILFYFSGKNTHSPSLQMYGGFSMGNTNYKHNCLHSSKNIKPTVYIRSPSEAVGTCQRDINFGLLHKLIGLAFSLQNFPSTPWNIFPLNLSLAWRLIK